MTLRLSPAEDETLRCLAQDFRTSKYLAAAAAVDFAAPRLDHPEFVRATTIRLMDRYSELLRRLAEV